MKRPAHTWALGEPARIDRNLLDDGQPIRAGDVFIERPDGRGYRRAAPHEIAADVKALAERARAGELEHPDVD